MKINRGFTLLELVIALGIIVILSSGVFLSVRQIYRRQINNASLQLQADLRYVQRRAIMEGREFGIQFDSHLNRYQFLFRDSNNSPTVYGEYVYLGNEVRLSNVTFTNGQLFYLPRGTPSNGGSIFLVVGSGDGVYEQQITVTPSGGRVFVMEIGHVVATGQR